MPYLTTNDETEIHFNDCQIGMGVADFTVALAQIDLYGRRRVSVARMLGAASSALCGFAWSPTVMWCDVVTTPIGVCLLIAVLLINGLSSVGPRRVEWRRHPTTSVQSTL